MLSFAQWGPRLLRFRCGRRAFQGPELCFALKRYIFSAFSMKIGPRYVYWSCNRRYQLLPLPQGEWGVVRNEPNREVRAANVAVNSGSLNSAGECTKLKGGGRL